MTKRAPKPEPERVVRRPKEERKVLSPELEAFAAGDHDAIWRRQQRGRLDDPRPVALVPGVKNADARAVFEARVRTMKAALEAGDEARLSEELAEAVLLELWRANSVVSFEALAEAVLGMALDRAEALAKSGKARLGLADALPEPVVAVWMRAEAALVVEGGGGRAHVRGTQLVVEMPLASAAQGLVAMGRRELPLVGSGEGRVVVDRPRGVPSMQTILDREAGIDRRPERGPGRGPDRRFDAGERRPGPDRRNDGGDRRPGPDRRNDGGDRRPPRDRRDGGDAPPRRRGR